MRKNGISITKDRLKQSMVAIENLTKNTEVLVGIPGETASREDDAAINNAQLGFIHEFGAPEHNIPARPFLFPGVRRVKDKVADYFKQAGQAMLDGNMARAGRALHAAGMTAKLSVQRIIAEGIPPPLKDGTLKARARRKQGTGHRIGKGAALELRARAEGAPANVVNVKPLIDSGQMLHAITYVVRDNG